MSKLFKIFVKNIDDIKLYDLYHLELSPKRALVLFNENNIKKSLDIVTNNISFIILDVGDVFIKILYNGDIKYIGKAALQSFCRDYCFSKLDIR